MITELTKEQIAKFPEYVKAGIEIGLDTNTEFDLELVKDLIQNHRKSCGIQPAEEFLVFDSPFAAIKEVPGLNTGNALYGQHDIEWLIYYMYYRNELGLVKETEPLVYLYELAKHVGWMWFGTTQVVITRKPAELHLREKVGGLKVLHHESDFALKYKDGTGVHALNGIRVPSEFSWVITTPAENLSVTKVLKIGNTEIRTEAIKKIGIERCFDKLDKKLLNEAEIIGGGRYQLYSVQLDEGSTPRIYLRGNCPSSSKLFFEAVHPDCKTVKSALNWRETGSTASRYTPPKART